MAAEQNRRRWHTWMGLLVILCLSYAIYSPATANDFTYDDAVYVKVETEFGGMNRMVKDFPEMSWWDYFRRPMGSGQYRGRGFRPVTVLSYAITHHLFRESKDTGAYPYTDDPRPHHVLNLWLHVLCTWLVYLLIARVAGAGLPALLGTAVFGLSSLHSDPVASIVGRGELLGFAFGAGATLSYAVGMERGGLERAWRLMVASALLFLSACSKESAVAWVVFPVVYVVALRLRADSQASIRKELSRQLPHAWSLGIPFLCWLVLWRMLVSHAIDFDVAYQGNPLFRMVFLERLPSAVMVLGYALYKLFWPFFLVSDYGGPVFGPPQSWLSWGFLVSLLVLLAILVGGFWGVRRRPLLFLAMASFFGFTFITSNIPVPIETIFGERLLYTAVLAQAFLVAWAAGIAARHQVIAGLLGAVLAAWLCACFWVGHQRTYDWKNNETLFLTDAEKMPSSTAMNMNAARVFRLREDWVRWREQIQIVMDHDPQNPIPYNELGVTYLDRGKFPEAEEFLKKALDAEHLELGRDGTAIYMNLANVMVQTHRPEEAKKCWRKVLRIDPGFVLARHQLLTKAYEEGNEVEALQLIQDGDLGPGHPDHLWYEMHRGMWAHKHGNHAAAVTLLRPAMSHLASKGFMEPAAWTALIKSLIQTGVPKELQEARFLVDSLLKTNPEPGLAAELRRLQRQLDG